MTIRTRNLILLAGAACLALAGGVAVSQTAPLPAVQWDVRRLDQLDRNVRRLERALTQRNAQGQPVLVEPDPEVIALTGRVQQMDQRVGDLEQSLRRINNDLERASLQADEAARDNNALRGRLTDADARIRALEEGLRAQAQAAQAAAQEPAAPAQPASPTGDAAADLAAARALTNAARQAEAYEGVIADWPGTPQGREASWRLGDLRRAGGDTAGAVQLYAGALNGWPTAAWAGEVTLKLARGLDATNREPQACQALAEFNRRYAATASAALKAIATQTRTSANCN